MGKESGAIGGVDRRTGVAALAGLNRYYLTDETISNGNEAEQESYRGISRV
jgi:hypothetical protein